MSLMTKIILAISITLCLAEASFGQIDPDSLILINTIKHLVQNTDQDIHTDSLVLKSGPIFSKNLTHKYIRLSNDFGSYIQIFSEQDNFQEPLFATWIHWMNLINDSIFDINGDQVADFSIHWYPSSGCCLADIYDCYIYDIKTNQFSEKVEIPNPTFYPSQSLTFSMTYGHPGETEFIELKWSATTIDTLKIFEWNNRTHDYLIVTDFASDVKMDLREIPQSLKELYGFEWFMMRLENEEE